jgi:hypothetical protein
MIFCCFLILPLLKEHFYADFLLVMRFSWPIAVQAFAFWPLLISLPEVFPFPAIVFLGLYFTFPDWKVAFKFTFSSFINLRVLFVSLHILLFHLHLNALTLPVRNYHFLEQEF